MKLLLELARSVKTRRLVHLLWRVEIFQLDIAKAEVVTGQLLRSHFLGSIFKHV